jgi:hypothetical protein
MVSRGVAVLSYCKLSPFGTTHSGWAPYRITDHLRRTAYVSHRILIQGTGLPTNTNSFANFALIEKPKDNGLRDDHRATCRQSTFNTFSAERVLTPSMPTGSKLQERYFYLLHSLMVNCGEVLLPAFFRARLVSNESPSTV